MPETTCTDSAPARLLPIVMPAPTAPPLGEWHGRGLCIGEDADVFFPSHGDPGTKAREICAACRVRDDCLKYAMEADEFGIWGGLDQGERQNLKRRQRRLRAATRATAGTAGTLHEGEGAA